MTDVITIGSATVDHIIVTDQKKEEVGPGDKILIRSLLAYTGGGASNTAVALRKLGLKVKVLAKLGADHQAHLIAQEFRDYGIKRLCQQKSPLPTSSSYIITSTQGEDRIIYIYKGASNDLRPDDFKLSKLRKTKWVYLATLIGRSFNTGKIIAAYCQEKKVPLLFNPSSYLARLGKKKLAPFLAAADILILNKKEARLLLQSQEVKELKILKKLAALGPKTVVITNGGRKIVALYQKKFYSQKPLPTKVVDSAGAGDAFGATLLAALIKKHPFPEALKMAAINASSVIQHHGAKNKLLTDAELLRKMKNVRFH